MLRILEIAAGVVIGGLVLALALIISFVTRWIDPHQIAIREHNRKARQEYKRAGLKPSVWLEPMRPGRSVEAESGPRPGRETARQGVSPAGRTYAARVTDA